MKIALLFGGSDVKGVITARYGKIGKIHAPSGTVSGTDFHLPGGGRLEIAFSEFTIKHGSHPTICGVMTYEDPFSFNLRDVNSDTPIFIPEFQAAVVPADDGRDYKSVAQDIAAQGLVSDLARFENGPEESYHAAARLNRKQYCRTWLGLGRDMRMFRAGYQERYQYWGEIQPCYHSVSQYLPNSTLREEEGKTSYKINFVPGHGSSCRPMITRRLEDGVLPILRSTQSEQDVDYNLTLFVTLEKDTLAAGKIRGSDWEACYACTGGNMLLPEQKDAIKDLLEAEMRQREQEVVCCVRVEAVNNGKVPRYAWFKAAYMTGIKPSDRIGFHNGFSVLENHDMIYAVNRINDQAMPENETAILLQPGQSVNFDILIPHSPINAMRAEALMKLDFDAHLRACRAFWRTRLDNAAKISVPEKPIHENIRAGLLHCDLVALGREPDGPVLATIGWYSPIGTESAPIIQFFDSMGWHELAERCIDFFFARQGRDGFIQNFANYQSETGPLLWTAGEHFRYTRDIAWVKRVLPNIKKAADYLLQWRERNKLEEYREKGFYGMLDGKVADPNDFYHSFFLNAGTYIGLKRTAEMLAEVDPEYADALSGELREYLNDIRAGFYHAQARAPVMPTGDGSWAPLMPPWVEYTGGISFYADGGDWFSHGAFASRSCLTGPLWLITGEVLDPMEPGANFMIKTNQYPVTLDNAALSQPYYCRHDFAHIRRGEIAAFLKTYYNQLTALHDRETYTFWEHYYHASEHKTHEEGWFLMQTRWMLWLEDGSTLRLLSAVPRAWMKHGKKIRLDGVKSYFGPIRLEVRSDIRHNRIVAEICMEPGNLPETVILRLPHPEGRRAEACSGGVYDPKGECVRISHFSGRQSVELRF